jgi:hypothetical protein
MNFNIDFDKWVNGMLPGAVRKPIMKGFLKVLASPVLAYYALTNAFYTAKLNELSPNLLTDVLQAQLRSLYPNTAGTNYKCWVYNQPELTQQVYLQYIGGHMLQENDYSIGESFTQEYDYNIEEQDDVYDYKVVIPVVYNTPANLAAINGLISKYKPAGRTVLISFQNIV